jgi:hypothetical protein
MYICTVQWGPQRIKAWSSDSRNIVRLFLPFGWIRQQEMFPMVREARFSYGEELRFEFPVERDGVDDLDDCDFDPEGETKNEPKAPKRERRRRNPNRPPRAR